MKRALLTAAGFGAFGGVIFRGLDLLHVTPAAFALIGVALGAGLANITFWLEER